MKIVRKLAESCSHGYDCPRVYETDQEGMCIVQGSIAGTAVATPPGLLDMIRPGEPRPVPTGKTPGGWDLFDGDPVTDSEILTALHLPDYETARIVPLTEARPC